MIIRGGLLALPAQTELRRLDLRIEAGRIAEIAPDIKSDPGQPSLEADGLMIFPGAIDPHVHFDDPGFTEREDFLHGSMEAARGGVTTVIDMPCTSLPPVTDASALRTKLAAIHGKAIVDYALFGGVSGLSLEHSLSSGMAGLAECVVGYKCYFISGMPTYPRLSPADFARVLVEGERLARPVLLHAEDFEVVTAATARVKATRGSSRAEWADYVASRPEAAELKAAAAALQAARGREAVLHVVHVGTAAAAELLAAGGASCETCPHYLAFDSGDFARLGAALKTAPPVKPAEKDGLWALLADGRISFISSDHAPAQAHEKSGPDIWDAYGGIPGTGTLFPYLYSEGYATGRLGLQRFLEATSGAAARRYGLAGGKGSLAIGKDADLVLVDPAGRTRVEGAAFFSKGKITPFEGRIFSGSIRATLLRGTIVYDGFSGKGGVSVEPGYGKHLSWGYR